MKIGRKRWVWAEELVALITLDAKFHSSNKNKTLRIKEENMLKIERKIKKVRAK